MKVFATGHRGYIGAHLVDVLEAGRSHRHGCDINLFEGCNWEPLVAPDRELIKDVRRIDARDLDGCDCVMHLAAISNDPMGEMNARLTYDVNRDASIRLAESPSRLVYRVPLFRELLRLRQGRETRPGRERPLNP